MTAEIVPLNAVSGDVVKGLRDLADRIERGTEAEDGVRFIITAVFDAKTRFNSYAWGECSLLEVLGAYALVQKCKLVGDEIS